MYNPRLLDHYHTPRNKGKLAHPTFSSGQYNPSCGDGIEITGRVENGRLVAVNFTGQGCIISQAAASLITEFALGKTIEQILVLGEQDMKELVGIQLGPTRLKCVMLCLQALQGGIGKGKT